MARNRDTCFPMMQVECVDGFDGYGPSTGEEYDVVDIVHRAVYGREAIRTVYTLYRLKGIEGEWSPRRFKCLHTANWDEITPAISSTKPEYKYEVTRRCRNCGHEWRHYEH